MRASFKTLLAAAATVSILAVPALADTYFFRSAEQIIDPPVSAISFASVDGVEPGMPTTSSIARIAGHRGKTASVVGGEYQICAADDCSDQNAWRSAPTPNVPSAFFARVRTTAPSFGHSAARLHVL